MLRSFMPLACWDFQGLACLPKEVQLRDEADCSAWDQIRCLDSPAATVIEAQGIPAEPASAFLEMSPYCSEDIMLLHLQPAAR